MPSEGLELPLYVAPGVQRPEMVPPGEYQQIFTGLYWPPVAPMTVILRAVAASGRGTLIMQVEGTLAVRAPIVPEQMVTLRTPLQRSGELLQILVYVELSPPDGTPATQIPAGGVPVYFKGLELSVLLPPNA